MTLTNERELADELRGELVRAGERVRIPDDGRVQVRVRVHQRRVRRRVQVSAAAVLAVVMAVAGVVVFEGRGREQSVPVVTGPDAQLRHFVPPLAPEGIDWWIEHYASSYAGSDGSAYYEVGFEIDGLGWSLEVNGRDDRGPDHDRARAAAPSSGAQVEVNGRSVRMSTDEAGRVAGLEWTDPSGASVLLVPHRPGPEPVPGYGRPATSWTDHYDIERPTVDQATAVAARVRPVGDAAWRTALMPPEGEPDPRTGSTLRPLRLGLDAAPSATSLLVRPWTSTQSDLDLEGFDPSAFRLAVSVPGLATAELPDTLPSQEGQPIEVRGVQGQLFQRPSSPDRSLDAGQTGDTFPPVSPEEAAASRLVMGYQWAITWEEGGSTVQLQVLDGPTVDEALAVANQLVVLDDARWQDLFSLGGELRDPDDPRPTTPPTSPPTTNWLLDVPQVVLPQLAPRGVEGWKITNVFPGQGYSVDFDLHGRHYYSGVSVVPPGGIPPMPGQNTVAIEEHPFRHQGRDLVATFQDVGTSVSYLDEDGIQVSLSTRKSGDELKTPEERIELLVAGLDVIEPVDDATWWAALNPAEGPVHLGPTPDQGTPTRLYVDPWTNTQLFLAGPGSTTERFKLTSDAAGSISPAPGALEGVPILVRGRIGTYVTFRSAGSLLYVSPPSTRAALDLSRAIVWEEEGSRLGLSFGAETSIDEAIALANGFARMGDTEWRALLNLG